MTLAFMLHQDSRTHSSKAYFKKKEPSRLCAFEGCEAGRCQLDVIQLGTVGEREGGAVQHVLWSVVCL